MMQLTLVVRHGAPRTSDMEPERSRAVACTTLVRPLHTRILLLSSVTVSFHYSSSASITRSNISSMNDKSSCERRSPPQSHASSLPNVVWSHAPIIVPLSLLLEPGCPLLANAPAHRHRASDARHATETQ